MSISVKHCTSPDPELLTKGNLTAVEHYYQSDPSIYEYRSKVSYSCDIGHEFEDESRTRHIYCQQSNTWTELIGNCTSMFVKYEMIRL